MLWLRRTKAGKNNLLTYTLADLPEMAHFPTDAARQKAVDEVAAEIRGWGLVSGIALTVCVGVVAFFLTRFAISLVPVALAPNWARDTVPMALTVGITAIGIRYLHRRGTEKTLRHKLLDVGVPICIDCGYLLRGLAPDAQRCPECGAKLDPRAVCAIATVSTNPNQPPTLRAKA
jgi:hypothetical protein